jgi:NitT/TauT family transport system substrate-binding protein
MNHMLRQIDPVGRIARGALLVGAVLTVGLTGSPVLSQDKTEVTLAGTPLGVHNIPELIALKLGFFAEEGIELNRQQFSGGSDAMNSLISGSADIGSAFFENAINLTLKGQHVKTFVLGQNLGGLVIVSGQDSGVASVPELVGKTVGVTSPGSGTDFFLRYALAKEGIEPQEVPVVGVGLGETAVIALEQGHVDAIVTIEPTVALLRSRSGGKVNVLVDTRNPEGAEKVYGAPAYPGQSLLTRAEWLEENPEAARGVAAAMVKALNWIHDHSPEEILAQLPDGKFGALPTEVAIEAIAAAKPTYSRDGRLTEQAAQNVYNVFADADPKYREANVDIHDLYTNEYLPE